MDSRQCLFAFDEQRQAIRLNNIEEVEKLVMEFGTHATVMRPQALAEWLGKTRKEWHARHAEEAESGKAGS